MNPINTTMSPNFGNQGFAGGGSTLGADGGLSSSKVAEVLAKLLEKANQKFDNQLQDAQNGEGAQGGQGAQGGGNGNQQNTAMLKVQQSAGEINTMQSAATSIIQGLTDAQKETARATH